MKENIETENIKKAYADIMRDHTAVEALKYSNYNEVPEWLNISNIKFITLKRTVELFKLTEDKEIILKEEGVDIPVMLIDNLSKAELSLHLDIMAMFGELYRSALEDKKIQENTLLEKETLNKSIDNGFSKKQIKRI